MTSIPHWTSGSGSCEPPVTFSLFALTRLEDRPHLIVFLGPLLWFNRSYSSTRGIIIEKIIII
jgi:hypothetical protein